MTKVELLIQEARQLPAPDRIRLLVEVERSLESDKARGAGSGRYSALLLAAGTAPSDFSDVSTEKYRHLASAIAPKPGDE
jgi:hypothetical protein